MAREIVLCKNIECAYFAQTRKDADKFLDENGEKGFEIVPVWNGVHFHGFMVMTPEQYDYYSMFFRGDSGFTGLYDSVIVIPEGGLS